MAIKQLALSTLVTAAVFAADGDGGASTPLPNLATVAATVPQVRIRRERRYRPLSGGAFHLLVQITAPTVSTSTAAQRAPLDLAFVLDRSGSMSGGAFDLAREAALHAIQRLTGSDSLSVSVFDNEIKLLLSQRWHTPSAVAKASRRLTRTQPRGSTNLFDGWMSGCAQLAPLADGQPLTPQYRPMLPRAVGSVPQRRVLLLTDGYANVGVTDPQALAQHAAALAARGVSTTTFGVGAGYDEVLLAGMADAGQGRFHHIASPFDIPQVFASELDDLLNLVTHGLIVNLQLPSGITARLLNAPLTAQPNASTWVRIGDLSAGETRTLIWEITLPPAASHHVDMLGVELRWQDPHDGHLYELTTPHALEARADTGFIDQELARALAPILVGRRRTAILEANRRGDYAGAQVHLAEARREARPYAGSREVDRLLDGAQHAAAPLPADEFKRQYAGSRDLLEGRQRPRRA